MTSLVAMLLAQTFFTWTDKAGVEHFTDDRSSIPKGAKITETSGDEISTLEVKATKPQRVDPHVIAVEESATEKRQRENSWREAFRAARNRVADLEAEVESQRKQVEEINGLPVTGRISCRTVRNQVYGAPGYQVGGGCYPRVDRSHADLENNRRLLQRAKDELTELERRASFDAVPLEWRR